MYFFLCVFSLKKTSFLISGHSNLEDMRTAHAKWLLETGQEETAGSIKESEGDYREALNLYLRAGMYNFLQFSYYTKKILFCKKEKEVKI